MIRQKKSLSQVFLKEEWPCAKIADQLVKAGIKHVLEIGPGAGALTHHLLNAGLKVTAVERDPRFIEKLNALSLKNLEVIESDILTFDIKAWLSQHGKDVSVCGNIPYHISTPILSLILDHLSLLKISFLLVQLEFAERVVSSPGCASYGALSIYAQLKSLCKLEFKVGKACFFPVPKVDSAVISIRPRVNDISNSMILQVEKITKKAFSQRRKKISNSLESIKETLEELHIDCNLRAENLTPQDYLRIANKIAQLPASQPSATKLTT